ncbi:hypothetical protein ACFQ05_11810 [Amycolatopsis umgeniensis]|uniref:Uncharacterized protein n=1 Tax=Amycolatopsis umgeniensis TaxID=336628 RepID=A0A841B5C1_9PSEU|nr:hypothetical protein [Amycolatopsis umgeniensis]MBB5853985.1 hypothetical protein [Amycolatopsis umgeniensis]
MQVNQPSNIIDRVIALERELAAVRKKVGLSSAIITRGGLTLADDSYIRMTDSDGVGILYIGPDSEGKQRFVLRREGGATLMFTAGSAQFGRDYWAMTDSSGRIIVSDSAETGIGLARPFLPIPLYPQFVPHTYTEDPDIGETSDYMSINVSKLAGETVLWAGRASVSHPWVTIDGTWGWAIGQPNVTYRLKFNGTEVGSWAVNAGAVTTRQGRFSVSEFTGQDWVDVQVTASASGSGVIACQVLGCYLT